MIFIVKHIYLPPSSYLQAWVDGETKVSIGLLIIMGCLNNYILLMHTIITAIVRFKI